MNEIENMSEEQQQQWLREQYQKATKYLADKGFVTSSVNDKESRYIVPFLAVWKLNTIDGQAAWVISGDLPTDHIQAEVANTAREAINNFSMKWQLQAENLLRSDQAEQHEFAKMLISRAEGLFQVQADEKLWANS